MPTCGLPTRGLDVSRTGQLADVIGSNCSFKQMIMWTSHLGWPSRAMHLGSGVPRGGPRGPRPPPKLLAIFNVTKIILKNKVMRFCAQCNIKKATNNYCREISVCYRGWGVVGGSIVLHQGHQRRSVFRQASGVRDTGCESANHLTEAYYRINVYYPATDSVSSDIQL